MRRLFYPVFSVLALALFMFCARADTAENMQIVYTYVTETLGYNRAAACGIMSNIQYESNFRPEAIGDSGQAYGICQWNSRRQSLINYCANNGFDSWQDIYGQLGYLGYELEHNKKKVGDYLRAVPDTPKGAYDAGWYFCVYFEIPANRYVKGVKRGTTAVTKYFTMYGGSYETYHLSFHALGGSGAPADMNKIEGVPALIPDSVPALSGYTFLGWSDQDGSDTLYQPVDYYEADRSAVFLAVYRPNNTGEFLVSIDESGATITGYTGSSRYIVIPSEYNSNPVVAIDCGAFAGLSGSVTVYVPATVTYIEEGAFAASVTLSARRGSAAEAYALAHGLEFIPVTDGRTLSLSGSITVISAEAFEGAGFSEADLSRCPLERVEAGAFAACPDLRTVILPGSVGYIAPDAFPEGVTISAPLGSYAQAYADEHGFGFIPFTVN